MEEKPKTTEEQIEEFRVRWLEAKKKNDTAQMKVIEIRAKLLKMGAKTMTPEENKDIAEKMSVFLL